MRIPSLLLAGIALWSVPGTAIALEPCGPETFVFRADTAPPRSGLNFGAVETEDGFIGPVLWLMDHRQKTTRGSPSLQKVKQRDVE